jgi:hypothetical protein
MPGAARRQRGAGVRFTFNFGVRVHRSGIILPKQGWVSLTLSPLSRPALQAGG